MTDHVVCCCISCKQQGWTLDRRMDASPGKQLAECHIPYSVLSVNTFTIQHVYGCRLHEKPQTERTAQ